MKKILSLFLAAVMLLSIFTVMPVFAATSQATNDGGTLWHKFDFENGSRADKINNTGTSGGNLQPVITSDGNGNFFGKYTVAVGGDTYAIATSSTLAASQDRYVVWEFDFKKDDTTYESEGKKSASPAVNFYTRESASGSQKKVHGYGATNALDWVHTVILIDRQPETAGKYVSYAYELANGNYTYLSTTTNDAYTINQIRALLSGTYNPGKSFYMDNIEIKTYKNFYEAINAAQSAQVVQNIIDRYAGLGIVDVPVEYTKLENADKASVAEKLINKNFASNAAVVADISSILTDEVFEKVYFNWDFEDGTILDSVNGTKFMTSNPNYGADGIEIEVVDDINGTTNKVAKFDYSQSGQSILLFTDVVDNAYAAGEFDYLTVDFKIYADQAKLFSAFQDMRRKNGSTSDAFYSVAKAFEGQTWHQFKGVINIPEMKINSYEFIDGAWELVQTQSLKSTFGFYRIGLDRAGNNCVMYYDDFKVTGYKSVVTEVNEASVNGVLAALETANSIGVINLPAAYATLDDAGKAAFAAAIKAKTYTTAAQINEEIKIYFATDDVVVLDSVNDANGNLDSLKLYVKKDGVNLSASQIYVAAYTQGELTGLTPCPQATAIATGSVINLSSLAIDVANATDAKVIILNNAADLIPVVKAVKLK